MTIPPQNMNQQYIGNPTMIPPSMIPCRVGQCYNGLANTQAGKFPQANMNTNQAYGPNDGRNQRSNIPFPRVLGYANQVNRINNQPNILRNRSSNMMNPIRLRTPEAPRA